MVTATHSPARTPHPLQAGPIPATLWLTLAAIRLAMTALAFWFAYVAGIAVADASAGMVFVLAGVALVIALKLAHWQIDRSLSLRVPGGLRHYEASEQRLVPTAVPGVTLNIADALVGLAAGVWVIANHVPGDLGASVLIVAFFATVLFVVATFRAGSSLATRSPHWKVDTISRLPDIVAGSILGALALSANPAMASAAIPLGVAVALFVLIGGWIVRRARGEGLGVTLEDLDDVSEDVLHLRDPAPTLQARTRAKEMGRVIAVVALVAALVALVAFASVVVN